MELFNMSPLELIFILIIVVIVVGPERAAEMAGQIGRLVASFRRNVNTFRNEVSLRMEEDSRLLHETQTELKKAADEIVEDPLALLETDSMGNKGLKEEKATPTTNASDSPARRSEKVP